MFKVKLVSNQMNIKITSTEQYLKQIVKRFLKTEECLQAFWMAKLALAVPVTNLWPECGGSAIKGIKTRNRSSMKNYLLNALFMVSINGPAFFFQKEKLSVIYHVLKLKFPDMSQPQIQLYQTLIVTLLWTTISVMQAMIFNSVKDVSCSSSYIS